MSTKILYKIVVTENFCFVTRNQENYKIKENLLRLYFDLNKNSIEKASEKSTNFADFVARSIYLTPEKKKMEEMGHFYVVEKSCLRFIQLSLGLATLKKIFPIPTLWRHNINLSLNSKKELINNLIANYTQFITELNKLHSKNYKVKEEGEGLHRLSLCTNEEIAIFKSFGFLVENSSSGIKHFLEDNGRSIQCNFKGLLYLLLIDTNYRIVFKFSKEEIKQIQRYLQEISLYLKFANVLLLLETLDPAFPIRKEWFPDANNISNLIPSMVITFKINANPKFPKKVHKNLINLLNNFTFKLFNQIFLTL